MGVLEHLKKHRSRIVNDWFKAVIATYPPEASKLFSNLSDSFDNPVGSTAKHSLENVFDALIEGADGKTIKPLLDPIIRIRAVQEFTPAQALYFVMDLKRIVRESLKKQLKKDDALRRSLTELDARIDVLVFVGFDIYVGCREQIYAFKANHVKDRTLRLLKKANVLCEVPEVGTEIIPYNVYKNGGFGSTETEEEGG